jgi:hypothetical protein
MMASLKPVGMAPVAGCPVFENKEFCVKPTVKLALAALALISLVNVAHAQRMSCAKDITYSEEFLAKYPDAGGACQEVRIVNGEKWARFNAQVKSNKNGQITVDMLNAAGNHWGDPLTFAYTPDATLTLENKKVLNASAVKKGKKIVVWIPERRFGLSAEPGAAENQQFKLIQP